jgi:hypothetical protein
MASGVSPDNEKLIQHSKNQLISFSIRPEKEEISHLLNK